MNHLKETVSATVIMSLVMVSLFSGFEAGPTIAAGTTEDQFTISQSITSEIAFATAASNITLSSLGGLTGGTSTGETHVNVLTNDNAGYTMTIKASSSAAMQGQYEGSSIADYTPLIAGVPDFTYAVPTGFEFGYTISASTTADLAQKFKDDGSAACNTGSADTNASSTCWYGLSTTATSTIVRSTETTLNGATTTIYFRLTVNANSSPVEDTYNATTTFTATTN